MILQFAYRSVYPFGADHTTLVEPFEGNLPCKLEKRLDR